MCCSLYCNLSLSKTNYEIDFTVRMLIIWSKKSKFHCTFKFLEVNSTTPFFFNFNFHFLIKISRLHIYFQEIIFLKFLRKWQKLYMPNWRAKKHWLLITLLYYVRFAAYHLYFWHSKVKMGDGWVKLYAKLVRSYILVKITVFIFCEFLHRGSSFCTSAGGFNQRWPENKTHYSAVCGCVEQETRRISTLLSSGGY